MQIHFSLIGGLDSRFLLGMKCSFPEKRKGLTEWKVKSVDYVQDFDNEALFLECSFYGMEGNVLNGIVK